MQSLHSCDLWKRVFRQYIQRDTDWVHRCEVADAWILCIVDEDGSPRGSRRRRLLKPRDTIMGGYAKVVIAAFYQPFSLF